MKDVNDDLRDTEDTLFYSAQSQTLTCACMLKTPNDKINAFGSGKSQSEHNLLTLFSVYTVLEFYRRA